MVESPSRAEILTAASFWAFGRGRDSGVYASAAGIGGRTDVLGMDDATAKWWEKSKKPAGLGKAEKEQGGLSTWRCACLRLIVFSIVLSMLRQVFLSFHLTHKLHSLCGAWLIIPRTELGH
jgi:hypothetical protein